MNFIPFFLFFLLFFIIQYSCDKFDITKQLQQIKKHNKKVSTIKIKVNKRRKKYVYNCIKPVTKTPQKIQLNILHTYVVNYIMAYEYFMYYCLKRFKLY